MAPRPFAVTRRRRETEDTWPLELEPVGRGEPLALSPGRFAMLYSFGIGEVPISVSGLRAGGAVAHTVRAVGSVTDALTGARPGDVVGVRGPFGTSWDVEAAVGGDVVVVDTAGRLQNKTGLMAELGKIARVLKKLDPSAPHEVLLVLDATTGQNAHAQVEVFRDLTDVTGLVITKLDGTARGGVLVALAERFGLPVYAIGVGEGAEDLQPFNADEFARALLGL